MAKLTWDDAGLHTFETGCDHGILFVKKDGLPGYEKGVAWNGLVSVTESPEGAEANAIYADNKKYLNLISAEEFKASIECYTYPEEFGVCNGEDNTLATGLVISQQARRAFCLVYRTKFGTANEPDKWHKLHIIYGCMATPTEKAYETVNDSPDAMTFSFDITCTPEGCTNPAIKKPIYHLEIAECTKTVGTDGKVTWTENEKYAAVENALCGDGDTEPTFQTPDQIIALMTATAQQ